MDVGKVTIAADEDFNRFKDLCECHDGWRQDYCKQTTTVWTKSNDASDFRMAKIRGVYDDVTAADVYDVLHDPRYRKTWDPNIAAGREICRISDCSEIGYYAMKLPTPLSGRDFVTQRTWRDLGSQKLIMNHSVNHASMPLQKGFIRGISYLTGYHVISTVDNSSKKGCQMTYITQSDPRGHLPVWVVNKSTQWMAPKVIEKLHKACLKYAEWKSQNNPEYKPWLHPEQSVLPILNPSDILTLNLDRLKDDTNEDESITEDQLNTKEIEEM